MQKINSKNEEKEVILKLKGWQIPFLLGAVRLGICAEDWCSSLAQESTNCFDSYSRNWILRVAHIIDLIKDQTGITNEMKGYGFPSLLNTIQDFVNDKVKTDREYWYKHEKVGNKTKNDNK